MLKAWWESMLQQCIGPRWAYSFRLCRQWDGVGVQRCGRVVCLSTSTTSRSWRPFVLWAAFTRLIWPCERCLDWDCQRCVGIVRLSPWMVERTAWHSPRRLMDISQTGPCLFLSAWLFWKSHWNDYRTCWRLAFGNENSHQVESHISRPLSTYDVKDVKRADDDGGVLYCGKRVRTVQDDVKLGGLTLRQDQTEFCESSLRTCKYVSSPSPTRESSVYDKRNSRDEKCDRQLALGNRRNTSRRVTRDKSVAEETISARGVGSQARRTHSKALEGLGWDWLRQSRKYPCPLTAWCVVMWSHSNLFHDWEEQDFETNNPVYFQSRSQCLSRRSWRDRIHASNIVWGIDGRKSSAWRMGGGGLAHPGDHGLWELVRLFGQRRKRAWRVHASCDLVRICGQLLWHPRTAWLKFGSEWKVSDFIIACPYSVCASLWFNRRSVFNEVVCLKIPDWENLF